MAKRWILRLLLPLLGLAGANGSATTTAPRGAQDPSAAGSVQLTGKEIPPAIRVESFLGTLALYLKRDEEQGTEWATRILELHGLDPSARSSQSLCEGALDLFDRTPRGLPEDPGVLLEPDRLEAEHERRRQLKARLAGEVVGNWIRDLEIEGRDVEPLLNKILTSPYRGITVSSTDPPKVFLGQLERQSEAFQGAVERALGYAAPASLRYVAEEVGNE